MEVKRIAALLLSLGLLLGQIPCFADTLLFFNDFSEESVGQFPLQGDPPYPPEGDSFQYNPVDFGKDAVITISQPIRIDDNAMLLWNKSDTNGQSFNVSGIPVLDNDEAYTKGYFRMKWKFWMDELPNYGRGPYFYLLTEEDSTTNSLVAMTFSDGPSSYYYFRTKNTSGDAIWAQTIAHEAEVAHEFTVDVNLNTSRYSLTIDGNPFSGLQGTPTANEGATSFLKWRFTSSARANYRYALDDLVVWQLDPPTKTPSESGGGAVYANGNTQVGDSLMQVAGGENPSRAVIEFPLNLSTTPSLATLQVVPSATSAKIKFREGPVGLELRHYINDGEGSVSAEDYDPDNTLTESLGIVVEDISSLVSGEPIAIDITSTVAADYAAGFSHSAYQLRLTDESQPDASIQIAGVSDESNAPAMEIVLSEEPEISFDLSDDQEVSQDDVYLWIHSDRAGDPTTGNFNADNTIDFKDLLMLTPHWMEQE